MRMKLRRLVAMGPRILESEAVGFHKQLVVAVMMRVEDVHMVLEQVAVVVNCSEFREVAENDELVLVVVGESYSELGVVEGNCSELVEVVVKVMVVASGELVEEVMAKVVAANALHMVVVKVVEVVLYMEVEEVVVVLYKEVGMVEVVNGLGEVENIQALEVVAVINRDKLVVGVNVEEGAVSEAVEVVNVAVVVVSVVVEVVNYSSMVLVGVGRTGVAVGVVNLVVVVEVVGSGHNME